MKRFSANISMLFAERPLLDRFHAARDAGFTGVEIQFPYDTPVEKLVAAKERAGLGISVINLPVPRVQPASVARTSGRVLVYAPVSLRVNPKETKGLRPISPAEAVQQVPVTLGGPQGVDGPAESRRGEHGASPVLVVTG